MATETNDGGPGLTGARLKIGAGLLAALVGFLGLADLFPLPLTDWASWFLFTALFFVGVGFTMFAIRTN